MSEQTIDLRLAPVREILKCVAKHNGISVEVLLGMQRQPQVLRARWMAARMLSKQGHSKPAVGRYLNRDHTTILWALRRMVIVADYDLRVREMLDLADRELVRLCKEEAERRKDVVVGQEALQPNKRQVERMQARIKMEQARRQHSEVVPLTAVEMEEAAKLEEAERARQRNLKVIAAKISSSKFERLKREKWSPASIARQMDIPLEYVKRALGTDVEVV